MQFRTMIKFSSSLTIAFLFSLQISSAQFFERTYPGLNLQSIGTLDNTIDSGFIISGSENGGFLLKVSMAGDTEWTRKDTNALKNSSAVIQDASGNFVASGSGNLAGFSSVAVVSSYDASGNFLSSHTNTGDWGAWGITITRSEDRNYSHYCYYSDGLTADNYFFLDNGDVISFDMCQVKQNGISIDNSGNYFSVANMAFDMDSTGTWHNNVLILSSNHFLRKEYFYDTNISTCAITTDGGVMTAGMYDTLGTQYLRLMKFDVNGILLWNTFLADSSIKSIADLKQTPDGGFAALCSRNDGTSNQVAFIKFDLLGSQLWMQEFYGNGNASPINFKILSDGFVILGSSNNDPYIIRTDSDGRIPSTTNINSSPAHENIVSIYPNPTSGIVSLSFAGVTSKEIFLSVFDLTGKNVFTSSLQNTVQKIDLSFLAKGIYQFRFSAFDGELKSGKLVVE